MFTRQPHADRRSLGLALCCALLVPALASAAGSITIKNETTTPVIVQAVTIVAGKVVRDKPYVLKPGDSSPAITMPGNNDKNVYMFETTLGRQIGVTTVAASTDDLYFAVVPEVRGKCKLEARKGAMRKP